MRGQGPMFQGGGGGIGIPSVPKVTRGLMGLFVGLSILAAVLGPWMGIVDLWTLLRFTGNEVLAGAVWKLVTYPWVADGVFGLVFGLFGFLFFVGQLEYEWGRKLFIQRIAFLVLAPVVLLTALSLVVPVIGARAIALGPSMLIIACLTAFASELRSRSIVLFPLPIQLTGDTILWLEGALLGLSVLFAGRIIEFLAPLISFGIALAWFRFDVARSFRRLQLRRKKKQLEARLSRSQRKRGHLRVVDDDEDGPPDRRYLH